jgi:ABC-type sugar transport system substrate-binding protein
MKLYNGVAALALGAAVWAVAPVGGASAADQFVIGVSNTHIGNSWREEFVCSIKAEALASGLVSKIVLANREAGPSEQIADLRTRRRSTASSRRRRRRESSSWRRTSRSALRRRISSPATR